MDRTRVSVVLFRPSRAANVAAAARALKNMGISDLRLVEPPELADPAARALAYGAWDLLDAATRHDSLRAAVADRTWVVGTSGRVREGTLTPRALAERWRARAADERLAVVFGGEASGLRDEDLALCHDLVRIPTAPGHPSLNLAQAVLLVAYELHLAGAPAAAAVPEDGQRAVAGEVEAALDHLAEALLAIGYLNEDNPRALLAEFRRLLARAGPTAREASLLRGLARQILWAARGVAPGGGRET